MQYVCNIVIRVGATDGINLVARSYGERLKPGDEIILTIMEHHSNLVPWQLLAQRTGARLRFVELDVNNNCLDFESFRSLLSEKTKVVAITHVSNVLGCINPIQSIVNEAHKY